jgi:hypothetical protein
LGERRMDVVELRAWCEALGMTLESFMAELIDRWQKQKALSHKAKSLTQSSGY